MTAAAAAANKPTALRVQAENIPAYLRERPQWFVWRYTWVTDQNGKGKWDKPPIDAKTGLAGSTTDPATWSTFDVAHAAYLAGGWDGVGFVPLPEDRLTIIDPDDCRDIQTGAIEEWASRIVGEMDTYTEVSPSAAGLRLVAFGQKPDRLRSRKGKLEIYDGLTSKGKPGGRYLTFTGHRLDGTPAEIHERGEQIATVYERDVKGRPPPKPEAAHESNGHSPKKPFARMKATGSVPPGPLSDEDFLRVVAEGTDAKLTALWNGSTSGHDEDDSRADAALLSKIAWWIGGVDDVRLDRLFRQSGLCREKWTEREGYRRLTLDYLRGVKTEFRDGDSRYAEDDRSPPAGSSGTAPASSPKNAAGIILAWFHEHYAPAFRRGAAVYSATLGREVKAGEVLLGAPSALIVRLTKAVDADRGENGVVAVAKLPALFRRWAPTAWADLLAGLKDEEESGDAGEVTADAEAEFRRQVEAAMQDELTIGREVDVTMPDGKAARVHRQERRSLLNWCQLFADSKKWGDIRSRLLWCMKGADGRLRIALRMGLFSQVKASCSALAKMSERKFVPLAKKYSVITEDGVKLRSADGKQGRGIELHPDFVAYLTARPMQPCEEGGTQGQE